MTRIPEPWPSEPAGWLWLKVLAGTTAFSFMMIGVGAFISVWGN